MTEYQETSICARLCRKSDGGPLLVDRESVAVGQTYWMTARVVANEPGALVAVWFVDNLVIPEWQTAQPDVETALRYIEGAAPHSLLVRAEFDLFFEVGAKGYTDLVRVPESGADSVPGGPTISVTGP